MVTLADKQAPRLTPALVLTAALALGAAAMLTACSAPAVDNACDISGTRTEMDHIISESGLVVASVDLAVCADSWTYVVATINGPGSEPSSDRFLFRQDTDMLVLMAPESVCENQAGNADGLPVVPDQLRAQVCDS